MQSPRLEAINHDGTTATTKKINIQSFVVLVVPSWLNFRSPRFDYPNRQTDQCYARPNARASPNTCSTSASKQPCGTGPFAIFHHRCRQPELEDSCASG